MKTRLTFSGQEEGYVDSLAGEGRRRGRKGRNGGKRDRGAVLKREKGRRARRGGGGKGKAGQVVRRRVRRERDGRGRDGRSSKSVRGAREG